MAVLCVHACVKKRMAICHWSWLRPDKSRRDVMHGRWNGSPFIRTKRVLGFLVWLYHGQLPTVAECLNWDLPPLEYSTLDLLYYSCVHLRLIKVFVTHKPNMMWRWNLHKSTSLAESQKVLEAHGCKSWVGNLSIVPHTLGNTNCIYYLLYKTTSTC